MKRILIVGYTNNMGGLESFILNYYRNINKEKIQFDFLVHYKEIPYKKEIEAFGGKVIYITRKSNNILKYKREMKKFFKENSSKYSAIWVNICSLSNNDHIKYAKKYKIPKRIIHSHNTNETRGYIRKLAHYFNKCFIGKYATDYWACSTVAGKWFYSEKIMTSNKYKVINNAINISEFSYNKEISNKYKESLGIKDKYVIGHVGRFCNQKNHGKLIDIFYEYKKMYPKAHLLLIGVGELEYIIKQKVKKLNIQDYVTFLGERDDIKYLMQAMDVFVLPSIYEGLPIVGIEAQISGLPCILANTITEEIRIIEECYFLSLDNLDKWVQKLEEFRDYNRENIKYLNTRDKFNIKKQVNDIEKFLGE